LQKNLQMMLLKIVTDRIFCTSYLKSELRSYGDTLLNP
jgi:hypothetical protein